MKGHYKYVKEEWVDFVKAHYLDYFRDDMVKVLMRKFKIGESYARSSITLAGVYPSRGKFVRKGGEKRSYETQMGLRQKLIKEEEEKWMKAYSTKEERPKFVFDDRNLFKK